MTFYLQFLKIKPDITDVPSLRAQKKKKKKVEESILKS